MESELRICWMNEPMKNDDKKKKNLRIRSRLNRFFWNVLLGCRDEVGAVPQRWRPSQQPPASKACTDTNVPLSIWDICLQLRVWWELGRAGQVGDPVINREVWDYLSLTVTPTSGSVLIFPEIFTHGQEEMKHQKILGERREEWHQVTNHHFPPRLWRQT